MQYPSPDQPFAVKAINRVGALARRIGIGAAGFDAEDLMRQAAKKTGLSDFGDEAFIPGLQILVESLNEEARLSTIGRIGAKDMLLTCLSNRLRIIDYRKERPEVAQQMIERPLFVIGLPRTGTTVFHELLAQDPNHRWPITYEVADPFPPARAESFLSDPRIPAVSKNLDQVETLAPGFRAIHPIGATMAQECIVLTSSQFMSEQFGVMYYVPSYNAWLRAQNGADAYRWHRMFLQHLQVDYSRPRWVLKSPGHLPFIQALVDEYPNAAIVQTHRDPMQVIASLASFACSLHSAFSDHVDPLETAAQETEHYAAMLQAGMEQRKQIESEEGPGRFFDVRFEDIVARPLEVMEELYAHFGFEWSADVRDRMHDYLENHPREKHGKHAYTLEQFGLSHEQHGPLFAGYRDRFGLDS